MKFTAFTEIAIYNESKFDIPPTEKDIQLQFLKNIVL